MKLTGPSILLGVILGACAGDSLSAIDEQCRTDEQNGIYPEVEKSIACGCEKIVCEPGSPCFHGDCCDPEDGAKNPKKCGCNKICEDGELCYSNECCNPKDANTVTNCGCKGPCRDTESCEADPDGVYSCKCDPEKNKGNMSDCGCNGKCLDNEYCLEKECLCNPLNTMNSKNPENCSCRWQCPEDAFCEDICRCLNADEVLCDGKCVPEAECLCTPDKHLNDETNCGCNGHCGAGEKCIPNPDGTDPPAICVCDPLIHLNDNNNCGCIRACETDIGESCAGGSCTCLEGMSDPQSCGCTGIPCNVDIGELCSQGECLCPSSNLSNAQNCACNGACEDLFPDIKGTQMVCDGGSCQCPPSDFLCTPPGNLEGTPLAVAVSACRPTAPDKYWCGDCFTFCTSGPCCAYDDNNNGKIEEYKCCPP